MSGWQMIGNAFGITALIGTVLISVLCIIAKACSLLPSTEDDER